MKKYDIDVNGDLIEAIDGEVMKSIDIDPVIQAVKLWYEDARESRRKDGLGTSMRNTYNMLKASGIYPESK